MRSFFENLTKMRRKAPKSFALLILLPSLVLIGYFVALLYFNQSFFTLWRCGFKQLTGFNCLACGTTHAVGALVRFHFLESIRYNPLPVLVAILLLILMIHAILNVFLRKEDRRFRGFWIWFYLSLAILIVYCILRNLAFI